MYGQDLICCLPVLNNGPLRDHLILVIEGDKSLRSLWKSCLLKTKGTYTHRFYCSNFVSKVSRICHSRRYIYFFKPLLRRATEILGEWRMCILLEFKIYLRNCGDIIWTLINLKKHPKHFIGIFWEFSIIFYVKISGKKLPRTQTLASCLLELHNYFFAIKIKCLIFFFKITIV